MKPYYFLQGVSPYNAGEIAGLTEEQAEVLLERKAVERYDEKKHSPKALAEAAKADAEKAKAAAAAAAKGGK